MTLLLVTLTLTLLPVLTVLRHLLEPACPACDAKSWASDPARLCCGECGWTSAAPAPAAELSGTQYEIRFG